MRDGGSVIDKLYQLSGADMLVAAQQQWEHSGIECSSNHGIILKLTIKRECQFYRTLASHEVQTDVIKVVFDEFHDDNAMCALSWSRSLNQKPVHFTLIPSSIPIPSHCVYYSHSFAHLRALSLSSPFTRPNQKHKENTLAAPPSVFLTPTGSADGLQLSCSVQTQRIKGAKSSQIAR